MTTSLSSYLPFLPAIITIIGWYVVAKQTEWRELRKEIREHLGDLRESGASVIALATRYWLGGDAPDAPAAAIELKAEVARLARISATLNLSGLAIETAELVADVREAATGGSFETKNRPIDSDEDSARLGEVASAVEDLLAAADVAYFEHFQRKSAKRFLKLMPLGGTFLLSHD